jgi:hypothetical protein
MGNHVGEDHELVVVSQLDKRTRFQGKWKTISMAMYVFSTVGMILCSTGATLLAALQYSKTAATLAGLATLLASTEKSLLFREKWRLHLITQTNLQAVELDLRLGKIDDTKAAEELKRIAQEYAQQLPLAPRT